MDDKVIIEELENYVNQKENINEELTSNDLSEIRKLIRVEIAEVMFDLFKKRGVWV